ncbi:MAG: pilus assembly protein PilM [Candidatus Omnitrophica bacterium]|nr:pilus assembly protein PilM [Candidatus Omnitrophota bacterium]
MPTPTTGIYIGDRAVELVQVKRNLLGLPKVECTAQAFVVGVDPEEENSLRDDAPYIDAVRQVVEQASLKSQDVITSVPPEDVLVRCFSMPRIPRKEWDTAITFEAKKYIPFRLEEINTEYLVINPRQRSPNMEVMFLAVKGEVLERHRRILQEAGLNPIIVEPISFALLRLCNKAGVLTEVENSVALVYMMREDAHICFFKDGALRLTRDVSFAASEELDSGAIAGGLAGFSAFGTQLKDSSAQEKLSAGTSGAKDVEVTVEKLAGEIELSFDYYKKYLPEEPVDKVILVGDSKVTAWLSALEEELGRPVQTLDTSGAVEDPEGLASHMSVTLGLALRAADRNPQNVNLLPAVAIEKTPRVSLSAKVEVDQRAILREFQRFVPAGILALIAVFVLTQRDVSKAQTDLEAVRSMRPKVDIAGPSPGIGKIRALEGEYMRRRKVLENLFENRLYWTDKLSYLGQVCPEGVWITNVSFLEDVNPDQTVFNRHMIVRGQVFLGNAQMEMDAVNQLITALGEHPVLLKGLGKPSLVSVQRNIVMNFDTTMFELRCGIGDRNEL